MELTIGIVAAIINVCIFIGMFRKAAGSNSTNLYLTKS
jgi:hypothetical protein